MSRTPKRRGVDINAPTEQKSDQGGAGVPQNYVPGFEEEPKEAGGYSDLPDPTVRRRSRGKITTEASHVEDVGYLNDETKAELKRRGHQVLDGSKRAGKVVLASTVASSKVVLQAARSIEPRTLRKVGIGMGGLLALSGIVWLAYTFWPVAAPKEAPVAAPTAQVPLANREHVLEIKDGQPIDEAALVIENRIMTSGVLPLSGQSHIDLPQVPENEAPTPVAQVAPIPVASPKPEPVKAVARVSAPKPVETVQNDDAQRRAAAQAEAMDAYFKKLEEHKQ